MALKCPKKSFELWFPKRNSSSECKKDNNLKQNSHISNSVKSKSPVKTSTKISPRLRNKISGSNVTNPFTVTSKLRKKMKKNVSKSPNLPQELTWEVDNIPFGSSDESFSLRDFCDVNSFIIEEEIDEILPDIQDCGAIPMTHNLSQVLEYSPLEICKVKMECLSEQEEDKEDEIQQDPLFMDNQVKDNEEEDNTIVENVESIKSKKSNIKSMSKEIKIELQHTVPPQHRIENTAGSRQLTLEQIQEFENYGPLKKGPFTKHEDQRIKENWKNFCKIHNWDETNVTPFLYMRHENGFYISDLNERKNFVRFLANGLPWRSLYSVNFRFRNLYTSCEVKGKYSAKEDEIIMDYMMKAPGSKLNNVCAEVAKILGRKRQSVWQHYEFLKKKYNLTHSKNNSIKSKNKIEIERQSNKRNHKKKENKQEKQDSPIHLLKKSINKPINSNVNWTAPLIKKFIDALIEVTSCKEVAELENRLISQETWKELENRTRIDCDVLEKFWDFQLHMQLFCTREICLDRIKVKLIEYLYEKRLQNLENIKWEVVQMDFPGITVIFLTKLFEQLIDHAKNNIDSSEFSDIIEYLYTNFIPELCEKPTDMVLPHIIYKRGRFICNSVPEVKVLRTTHNPLNET